MFLLTAFLFLCLSTTIVLNQPVQAAALPTFTGPSASFAAFDRRARDGDHLNVVFFGASLTWGANSSDPQQTSYRADVARQFQAAYPKAHFTFWDPAIGGTGSQLGVFRLDRDVLRHHPDLVFLDFTANDNIFTGDELSLASYESLVRRIILDGHAPVVQMIFPFRGDVARMSTKGMKRRDAHLAISAAYNTAVGDAVVLGQERIASKQATIAELWPIDGTHPGDAGYQMFADAAWQGYESGVSRHLVCRAPLEMLHADTFMNPKRVRISTLGPLPAGWRIGIPNRVSAYFDMLMSRWLDDVVIASDTPGATKSSDPIPPRPLTVRFTGSYLMLYGESTQKSGTFKALIDGKPVSDGAGRQSASQFDVGSLARRSNGNVTYQHMIVSDLDPSVPHTLTILPILNPPLSSELRLESICVAGGKPNTTVSLPTNPPVTPALGG